MTNSNGALAVTRFWLHTDGARVELTDGSQHVVTVSDAGTVDGIPAVPALQLVRDAIAESDVPHAVTTANSEHALCAGWDDSWGDAHAKADEHWALTERERAEAAEALEPECPSCGATDEADCHCGEVDAEAHSPFAHGVSQWGGW
jgi:hypothetical protein